LAGDIVTGTDYLVGGRYQVGDRIGVGGMSEVHRARDLRLGGDVAVKVLRADLADDPAFQARFRREAQNAASLNHPAIVAVFDTGETDSETGSVPYIVMEFVDGETLRDMLGREGPLPRRQAMEIIADVCAALDFSHRHGLVHRDVKPANIMLDRSGAVKVMDFGIARSVADDLATMRASASIIGTAQYLAPEQARGEAVDARSDVYATGCVLYELLCGTPPFTGDSPVAVAYKHVHEAARPPSATMPGLPKDMDAIVLKALNKNPLNRYQTAAEMRLDLVRALAGQPVQATPLMSDRERAELMRTAPTRVVAAPTGVAVAAPPLLAPPSRPVVVDEDWEPDGGNRARRVWGFLGIAVLCVALLAGAVWLTVQVITAPPPTALVAVPDLSGMSLEQAGATLTEKGLTLGTTSSVDSTDAMTERVVGQRPSSHTQVNEHSPIDLEIGHGVSKASVPNVVGSTADAARQAISNAHLVYAEQQQPSADPDRGKVIAQDPPAEAALPPNTTVTVTIGTGLSKVTVPGGVVGKNLDQATATLQAARLTVVTQDGDGVEPAGQVIAMDQQPGEQIPEDTPVTLTLSNNSLMVMPDLRNQTRDQAVATLQSNGWAGDPGSLGVTDQPTTAPEQIGAVLGQQPAAGSKVRKTGTPVTVAVGVRQITVPDVVGKTQKQAADLLTKAGATKVTFANAGTPPRGQAGRVQAQSVPANATVSADTAIVVSVYGN
jgi:serine/threonine-protein kinase